MRRGTHRPPNLIVVVTSFGLSSNGTGIGGAHQIVQPDDLAFLAEPGVR